MPSNFTGWIIAGAGFSVGVFVAELALRMFGTSLGRAGG